MDRLKQVETIILPAVMVLKVLILVRKMLVTQKNPAKKRLSRLDSMTKLSGKIIILDGSNQMVGKTGFRVKYQESNFLTVL